MLNRIDAGTDIALIGAWDAERKDGPLDRTNGWVAQLERDAEAGRLFLIHTGADGGGPIDVYVDAEVPASVRKQARALGDEFLISVLSGRLMIGGVEDYRAAAPRITAVDNSVVRLPAGDYALRCYAGPDEEQQPSEKELKQLVGAENLRWYDRMNNRVVLFGFATLLLFPALAIPFGWMIALAATAVVFFAYWPLATRLLKGNERYVALEKIVTPFRLANEPPTFIFELRRIADSAGLRGGSVRL